MDEIMALEIAFSAGIEEVTIAQSMVNPLRIPPRIKPRVTDIEDDDDDDDDDDWISDDSSDYDEDDTDEYEYVHRNKVGDTGIINGVDVILSLSGLSEADTDLYMDRRLGRYRCRQPSHLRWCWTPLKSHRG
jgi:hypothetical protein